MKIILVKDVPNVGREQEVVEVSEGYARNYLFPRKAAIVATASALLEKEKNKERHEKKLSGQKEEIKKIAEKLEELSLEIKADAGEGGKLFGSVTSSDIASAIKNAAGIDVDKKRITIDAPIKTLGDYIVSAKLYSDIEAKIKIQVIPSK
jgi:large subunit ribosomal protein L9